MASVVGFNPSVGWVAVSTCMVTGITSIFVFLSSYRLAEMWKTRPDTLICDPSMPKCNSEIIVQTIFNAHFNFKSKCILVDLVILNNSTIFVGHIQIH